MNAPTGISSFSTSTSTPTSTSTTSGNTNLVATQIYVNTQETSIPIMVEVDQRGPRIIGTDGTSYSYCANWSTIEHDNRQHALEQIGQQNLVRLNDAHGRREVVRRERVAERRPVVATATRRRLLF
jgi:hypothetical protein